MDSLYLGAILGFSLQPQSTRLPAQTRQLYSAFSDLYHGFRSWELWSTLGWHDIRKKYRRSTVGPFWLTISMAVMIAGIGYLYAGLFSENIREYLPYVATGIIIFTFITTIIGDATTTFIAAAGTILQVKAPLSIYIYQMIWRNFIIFAHNILIYFAMIVILGLNPGFTSLLALLGLLLIAVTAVWTTMILATLSARFRDVPPIVASITQVSFFLTPIFWRPEAVQSRRIFVEMNPFYYFVEIVRQPLLGKAPSTETWLIAIGISLGLAVIAILFFKRFRARVAYWV